MNEPKKPKNMHTVIDEVRAGINSANGILSRLWRLLLSRKQITAHKWERLFKRWIELNKPLMDETALRSKKGGLPKALAKDHMTWKVFIQGLQVLNSYNEYSFIRFEIHLKHRKSNNVDIVGLNVIDKTVQTYEEVDDESVETLTPGKTAIPGKTYRLEGFDNTKVNGKILRRVGEGEITPDSDYFDGCFFYLDAVIEKDGRESTDWIRPRGEV
jgi:hypothetical protein